MSIQNQLRANKGKLIIILIILFLIWLLCGFESACVPGFVILDLNLPSPLCMCDAGQSGELISCSQPGLDITMRADENLNGSTTFTISQIMDLAKQGILTQGINGTEWIETHTKVGVSDAHGRIPCLGIASNAIWQDVAAACERAQGLAVCNPEFVGCQCTGGSFGDCAWTIKSSNPNTAVCGGTCESGKSCIQDGDNCGCDILCEDIPMWSQEGLTCTNGWCPTGETCNVGIVAAECECFPLN